MLPDADPRKKLVSNDLITYVEDRKGHDRRYAIAPDKIKAEIGWEPETMFKEGIKKTIKWFFEHEDWMKNVTSGDYQKYYRGDVQRRIGKIHEGYYSGRRFRNKTLSTDKSNFQADHAGI